jgi:hypothetical protein
MGVMNTESILSVILAAATVLKEPAATVAAQAVKDLYEAAKYYLRRKFVSHPEAIEALEFATAKPHSSARKAALIEEAEPAELHRDPELTALVARLETALCPAGVPPRVSAHVTGRGNQVNVAGRDLVVTSRLVRRNVITPDDRHLAREQRARLLTLIHEVAERMAGENGQPNLGAVHHLLQRRFAVSSYLLIPRERYAEALSFLQQQRAMRRGVLRRRNPDAFRRDLFRAVFSRATEIGWPRQKVYAFAQSQLDLKRPVTSLKQLGPVQLQALAEKMRRTEPAAVVA